jgi:multiple sugar transport system permease protein
MNIQERKTDNVKAVLLLIFGVIVISPLFLLFVSSLKDDRYQILAELGSFRAFIVTNPSLNNFVEILGKQSVFPMGRFFLNSVIILMGTVVGTIFISSMGAYALLRGKFKINKWLIWVILGLYIIPLETIMLPLLFEAIKLKLVDTYLIQILPFIAHPLFIYLCYQSFRAIPEAIGEAAGIDGASFWQIYRHVYVPLSVPIIVSIAILQGMETWNQYLWPLLITQNDRVRPMAIAIAGFFGQDQVYWDKAFAASVLMMIPVLGIYLFFQRYFLASVASSAVKE